jgi:four helix bundle protein
MARFETYDLALTLVTSLAPLLERLAHHDRDLASQLRRAASSVTLCISEGARRAGRDRLHLYRVAAGSAAEVASSLDVASAWSYLGRDDVAEPRELVDRLLAMLWRLTHPRA